MTLADYRGFFPEHSDIEDKDIDVALDQAVRKHDPSVFGGLYDEIILYHAADWIATHKDAGQHTGCVIKRSKSLDVEVEYHPPQGEPMTSYRKEYEILTHAVVYRPVLYRTG